METIIEKYNQETAKNIVDALFDSKIFCDDLTRDDLQNVEEILALTIQQNIDSFKKVYPLLQKFKK